MRPLRRTGVEGDAEFELARALRRAEAEQLAAGPDKRSEIPEERTTSRPFSTSMERTYGNHDPGGRGQSAERKR